MSTTTRWAAALTVVATAALGTLASAQHAGHGTAPGAPAPAAGKLPAPVTMEELHKSGGVPRGWKFTLPAGDPKTGREIFAKLECNKCHEVNPDFPRGARGSGDVGPELTGMGALHPAEYLAESIVAPNAVILAGPGWVGSDGRSVMPDYRDSLTLAELVDLVAYVRSLGGGEPAHQDHGGGGREQAAGPYRVRVMYHPPAGAPPPRPAAHGQTHQRGPSAAGPKGHLMVFVADAATGEPVPYLPVSAVVTAGKAAPVTVRLAPMIGGDGFHYGADVALPAGTTKVTLSMGAAGLRTMGPAAGRFSKPVTVSFDWSD